MSDLAPFVAASLRDKVVAELHEELESIKKERDRLKGEQEPWTVKITGPGGSPVYATGKLSLREVLLQSFVDNVHLDSVTPLFRIHVDMQEREGESCPFGEFLQCEMRLTAKNGLSITELVDIPGADIGNGIRAHNGRFEIGWCFFGHGGVFEDVYLDIPIPNDRLDSLDPDLVEGLGETREDALPIAEETVGRDAPIRFYKLLLHAQPIVALLEGGDEANDMEE